MEIKNMPTNSIVIVKAYAITNLSKFRNPNYARPFDTVILRYLPASTHISPKILWK